METSTRTHSGAPHDAPCPAGLLAADGPLSAAWGRRVQVLTTDWLAPDLPDAPALLRTPLLRPPYVVVLRDGRPVSHDEFCRTERIVLRSPDEVVLDTRRVASAVEAGAAVKFNRLELWEPTVADVAARLAAACGRRVRVYGFWTPPGSAALPVHRDAAHVLVAQITGRKRWQVHGPPPATGWSPGPCEEPGAVTARPLLEVGDLLYLPHGTAHQAIAQDGASFHLSFTLLSRTAGDLRRRIIDALSAAWDVEDSTELDGPGLRRVTEELCASLRHTAIDLAERLARGHLD
ncbi:JmjC domain-containing protein [Streptomyces sp. V4I23]|uniref:JmjC domain-containing protein n=1 Tax=Streptomyces sp. V4I23 TaxID=3042282 RepID=UPI0027D83C2A|nr:cupin domain-containing protein [Streptomyces sp. V4I23]